jgi:hypothetical protein
MLECRGLYSRARPSILEIYITGSFGLLLFICQKLIHREQLLSRYKTWLDNSLPTFEAAPKVLTALAADKVKIHHLTADLVSANVYVRTLGHLL